MFTGLIEDVGKLVGREKQGDAGQLKVSTSLPVQDIAIGDSVAVNGACLTVETIAAGELTFHTLSETLQRTNLGRAPLGSKVNLERALRVGDRLGGHFVMGHVDQVAIIRDIHRRRQDIVMGVSLPPDLAPLLIPKGSIAVNGISLTIAKLEGESFFVHIIPHTWEHTSLTTAQPGDTVNLEADMIGKYIVRFQRFQNAPSTMDDLRNAGF